MCQFSVKPGHKHPLWGVCLCVCVWHMPMVRLTAAACPNRYTYPDILIMWEVVVMIGSRETTLEETLIGSHCPGHLFIYLFICHSGIEPVVNLFESHHWVQPKTKEPERGFPFHFKLKDWCLRKMKMNEKWKRHLQEPKMEEQQKKIFTMHILIDELTSINLSVPFRSLQIDSHHLVPVNYTV